MSLTQRFFKVILPATTYQKIETKSREWYFQCDCGNRINLWETGGIRFGAIGNPKRLVRCPVCQKIQLRALQREIL